MNPNEEPGRASGETVNIWIIEDNTPFRISIEGVINKSADMRCPLAVPCCEDALAVLKEGDAPDIVLMDIGLPGMSGIEGARLIHDLSPSTRVIMLTVHEDNEKIFAALCAGASGYLLKPASMDHVVTAIREVQRGGASINAQVARKVLGMFTKMAVPQGDYGLSTRETEILNFLVEGLGQNAIAEKIHRSQHTVNNHIRNIYAKLHVNTRSGAVAKALKERLIQP